MNSPTTSPSSSGSLWTSAYVRGAVGAVIGGAFGFGLAWFLKVNMGLYAVAMPGAFLGLGCGTLSRVRSIPMAILCVLAGFALGVVTEWFLYPMKTDSSLTYFLQNLDALNHPKRTWMFVGIGTLFAGWFGLGRQRMMITVDQSD